jgi:hypothetical protein
MNVTSKIRIELAGIVGGFTMSSSSSGLTANGMRLWALAGDGQRSAVRIRAKSASPIVNRGAPFGTERWQARTAKSLGLEWTLRARGRPRKPTT